MFGLLAKAKKCFFRRFKRNINWRGKWKAGSATWTGKIEGEKEEEKNGKSVRPDFDFSP